MSNPCIHRAPPDSYWEEVYPRLLNYAIWLTRGYNAPSKSILLPKGRHPSDIVSEAIMKFYNGKRKWDPAKVDLEGFLKGIIRSDINHLYTSSETKTRSYSINEDGNNANHEIASPEFPHPDALLQKEQLLNAILSQLTGPLEQEIFQHITAERTRQEILAQMRISPSTYDRILKKIRTITSEIMSEQTL